MEQETGLSKSVAVVACASMTFFYVAILHAPTLILRLPPPSSLKQFLIRRFICAAICSIVSVIFCALILPIRRLEASLLFGIYGIRLDHIWQAVAFPLSLTSLMYAGSFLDKLLMLVDSWKEDMNEGGGGFSFDSIKHLLQNFVVWMSSTASNVMAWRNFVVAPLTEELVFRACMISLLLCGGFKIYSVIFLCPILFSLAHLNHWMEIYVRHNYSMLKASMVVGLQLGYTVIFGSYASFLFIRTGMVTLAFVAGVVTFSWLLFPVTSPDLYNDQTNNCRCWHGYCSWN
ncbi:CAAX prenyl protease 2 isoform X3 [Jatropha curcas]|uniref:CAAX prenyl protease 2 isoform X3 n=1 Tax=Jatropha curcas TaxID=180498 RepID=UPI0018957480|nr:CAAX prenyl protease 2 isoform X3 [Jatropha curcas]